MRSRRVEALKRDGSGSRDRPGARRSPGRPTASRRRAACARSSSAPRRTCFLTAAASCLPCSISLLDRLLQVVRGPLELGQALAQGLAELGQLLRAEDQQAPRRKSGSIRACRWNRTCSCPREGDFTPPLPKLRRQTFGDRHARMLSLPEGAPLSLPEVPFSVALALCRRSHPGRRGLRRQALGEPRSARSPRSTSTPTS